MITTDQVFERLSNAPEGVDTYDAAANKNTVDVFILHNIKQSVFEEWMAILREEAGCGISYGSSIGRTAIHCKAEDEPQVRAAIEATLPGLRHYYETVLGPETDAHWDIHCKLPACWYVTDRGYYRRVSATATPEQIHTAFRKLGIPLDFKKDVKPWDSCQRGHALEWAQTYLLAKDSGKNVHDACAFPTIEVPEHLKHIVPEGFTEQYRNIERTHEKHIRLTEYLVEATSEEKQYLWRDYSHQGTQMYPYLKEHRKHFKGEWKQVGIGYSPIIGTVDDRPICITIFWDWIDGHLVGFWEPQSQLVDYKMIREWLDETFGDIPKRSASRFVDVMDKIQKSNGVVHSG